MKLDYGHLSVVRCGGSNNSSEKLSDSEVTKIVSTARGNTGQDWVACSSTVDRSRSIDKSSKHGVKSQNSYSRELTVPNSDDSRTHVEIHKLSDTKAKFELHQAGKSAALKFLENETTENEERLPTLLHGILDAFDTYFKIKIKH